VPCIKASSPAYDGIKRPGDRPDSTKGEEEDRPMAKKYIRIEAYVSAETPELYEQLRQEAFRQRVSMGQLIKIYIKQGLEQGKSLTKLI